MNLMELLAPWIIGIEINKIVTGLQNDSRNLLPGNLFLAYPGAVTDGRLFIEDALSRGAAFVVYEPENWPSGYPLPSTEISAPLPGLSIFLSAIASRFFDEPSKKMSITGITGTNGKTSIAYQLAQAHELLGNASAYIGTLGYGRADDLTGQINTTPDALFLQKFFAECTHQNIHHVGMEVSSHALYQHRVDHIHFHQAIFTNLSLDHLDYHKTMDAYAKAKALLFSHPSLQWAIINQDDAYAGLMSSSVHSACKVLTYGLANDADVRVVSWKVGLHGTEFDLLSPWGSHQVLINALGFFNVYNALAIFCSLMLSGYSAEEVVAVMTRLRSAPGRMEVITRKPYVIVDFAHSPDALENVLRTLSELKQGKIITVFGCGGDRDKSKRPVMGDIASRFSDMTIITSDNPRSEDPLQIMAEIAQGVSIQHAKVLSIADRKEAISAAVAMAEENDIVLVAGKGHEAYQLIGNQRYEFSDQAVIRELTHSIHQ